MAGNLGITAVSAGQNNKSVTQNSAHDNLDLALTDLLSKAVTDGADTVLTTAEGGEALANMIFQFTGALTANRNVIVPTNKKLYMCENQTTGGYTVTVKTSGGSGVALVPGEHRLLYCDGTNVIAVDPGNVGSFSGCIAGVLKTQVYALDQSAAFDYDVIDIVHQLGTGTDCTFDLEIDGSDITGIAAQTITTSEATDTATAANSASTGARLGLNITARTGTPEDLYYTVRYVRT